MPKPIRLHTNPFKNTRSTIIMNIDNTIALVRLIAKDIEANKEYLTELDTAIGDADHGINLSRGFAAVLGKLDGADFATVGDVLKTTAMTLISTVGGASGPLYGTLFLKLSGELKKEEVNLSDFCVALEVAIEGIKARGKAQKGEKTMLDVLIPVLDSLKDSATGGDSAEDAFNKAEAVAKAGYEFTKTIAASKGRASYLGERSIGHIDPGCMSSYLMVKTTAEFFGGRR
jgi:dihydroxyacetone kinase-like protein